MNYRLIIAGIVVFSAGAAVGLYSKPAKIVTKTETQTVTQVITKTVEVDKTDYHKNKVLVETTITKPDGTVIRKREFVDKSEIVTNDQTNTDSNSNSSTKTSTETSKTYASDKVSVRALVARNMDHISEELYGVGVDKKLIGPFTVGAFGLTDKTLGLSLGMNF